MGEFDFQTGEAPFRRLRIALSSPDAELELNHLLRRLFTDLDRLVVCPMSEGRSGAGVLRVERHRGGDRLADVLVKYGAAGQIRDEVGGWRAMEDYFEDHRFTQLGDSASGRYMGVLTYNLIGAVGEAVVSFEQFYRTRPAPDSEQTIKQLFSETLSLGHRRENRKPQSAFDLHAHYESLLNAPADDVVRAFEFKYGRSALIRASVDAGAEIGMLEHPVAALQEGWRMQTRDTWLARTHGDLHGENVLIKPITGEPWLIDFGRSGLGHWARDFAMLETCIKFQYLPLTAAEDWLKLELTLLNQASLEDPLSARWDDDPYLDRALRVIGTIRTEAARAAAGVDESTVLQDYTAALFLTSLNYFRFHKILRKAARKKQVLVTNALLFREVRAAG